MRFSHSGLECMTRVSPMGVPCGYVGVASTHPDYGKHYDNVEDIEVHGGLTFSGYWQDLDDRLWYFGFDCGQAWDIDEESFEENYMYKFKSNKSPEYVEEQTRRLAEQLEKRQNKNTK
jgi:hypothetical protein